MSCNSLIHDETCECTREAVLRKLRASENLIRELGLAASRQAERVAQMTAELKQAGEEANEDTAKLVRFAEDNAQLRKEIWSALMTWRHMVNCGSSFEGEYRDEWARLAKVSRQVTQDPNVCEHGTNTLLAGLCNKCVDEDSIQERNADDIRSVSKSRDGDSVRSPGGALDNQCAKVTQTVKKPPKPPISDEWYRKMAEAEEGYDIGAGSEEIAAKSLEATQPETHLTPDLAVVLQDTLHRIANNPTETSNGYSNLENWVRWAKETAANAERLLKSSRVISASPKETKA